MGLAKGMTRNVLLALLGTGFVLTFFDSPVWPFGLLLIWLSLATLVVNAGCMFRAILAWILTVVLMIPGLAVRKLSAERRASLEAQHRQEAAAAAAKKVAEEAKRAAEKAVQDFPARKRELTKDLSVIETLAAKKDRVNATAQLTKLHASLDPVFASDLAKSADVAQLKDRVQKVEGDLHAQQAAYEAAVRTQQAKEAALKKAIDSADPMQDLQIVRKSWKKGGFNNIALWHVTIRNKSTVVVYSDIAYVTEYSAPSGTRVDRGSGKILDVIQPGQTRSFEVNDGFLHSQAARADFVILTAEKTAARN